MPDNVTERQPLKFDNLDLGIESTQQLDREALSNFLDGEPEELTEDEKKKKPTVKPVPDKKADPKLTPKKEEPLEEEVDPNKTVNEFLDGTEEGEEVEKETEEELTPEGEKQPEAVVNPYKGLSKDLLDIGIFSLDEDETEIEIETAEDLRDRFEYEKKKGAGEALEAFLSRKGPEYSEMFESVFVNGVDPVEYLGRYSRIQDLKNLDLKEELNQERVVREKLRLEGMTPEEVGKKIEKLRNYNDLEEEATIAHRFLLKREEEDERQANIKKIEEDNRKIQQKNHFVQAVNRILTEKVGKKEWDGIPIDVNFAREIAAYVAKDKYKVGDQYISEFDKEVLDLNRPENYELKVKLAVLLKMVKVDPTLSKIQKRAVTKETNQLFQSVKSNTNIKKEESKQIKKEEPAKSWF